MADPFAFQSGQQTIDLSTIVKRTAESSFLAFKELCDSSKDGSDTEKKIALLKFINKTRQRLLRLRVLSKWCSQIPLVESCQKLVGTLSNHDTSFVQAADSLFFLHEGLQQARAPMYDIPSAVEVLLTGCYKRLPKCIEDLGIQPMLSGDEKQSTLQKLDTMLRSQLLDVPLPREVSSVKVANGMVTLLVDEEFEVQLTVGYRGNPSLWRVLNLNILVGESGGKLKLIEFQEAKLKDDLERRMAVLDDPFQILYVVLHEFCTTWVMDTILRQVHALQKGRWKDAIRMEIIQEGPSGTSSQATVAGVGMTLDAEADIGSGKLQFSQGLKIVYWLDVSKGGDPPFLRIEQGPDHHIACSHVPLVLDSENDYDAQFHINMTSVDVECLLLRAISCSIHTRLLDVYKNLRNHPQICRTDSDVFLYPSRAIDSSLYEDGIKDAGEVGEELLCVRAYGQYYLALAINIRTGKFVLRCHNVLLSANILTETEDALSQGSLSPFDAFISLRNKSLLQLYASIGATLNLKVYEKGVVQFRKWTAQKLSTDSLVMGFPNCGETFFLVIQLDNHFMPTLTLIEGIWQQGLMVNGPVHVLRQMNINIGSFIITSEEMDFCFMDGNLLCQHGRDVLTMGSKGEINSKHYEAPGNIMAGSGLVSGFISRNEKEGCLFKRKFSESFDALPSLQGLSQTRTLKKRKISVSSQSYSDLVNLGASNNIQAFVGQPYSNIIEAANEGKIPLSSYTSFLLQVIRICSVSIKQARLTSQMKAFNIPFLEEIGLRKPSTNLWFRLHPSKYQMTRGLKNLGGWEHVCMCLGKPGSEEWSVKIQDDYMRDLFELQKLKNSAIASEADSHIQCSNEGVVLLYETVEDDSIKIMLEDLDRLWNARTFALGIKHLLEDKLDEKGESQDKPDKSHQSVHKGLLGGIEVERVLDATRPFRLESIGLTSISVTYIGYVIARFVVEWEKGKKGCTVHVSPEQLWPHTKYLEDYINGKEVELLLDCIRVTAGPLQALASAIRPARMPVAPPSVVSAANSGSGGSSKTTTVGQVISSTNPLITSPTTQGRVIPAVGSTSNNVVNNSSIQSSQNGPVVSGPGRGTGLVPSSLLPTDVSVVLRSPFWIRIVYRRQFAVDMRCFAGDQVWLQPAPPPRGSISGAKGSLPCPQFRPFVMDQITTGYSNVDPASTSGAVTISGQVGSATVGVGIPQNVIQVPSGISGRVNAAQTNNARTALANGSQTASNVLRMGGVPTLAMSNVSSGRAIIAGMSTGVHPNHRELSAAGYGFSDDGGYGGVWVPLGSSCLKKVLRGTLRYLGVVWLFTQFPDIIKDVLASHLNENEGALLNHDPETPALRFYIQNCVFAVSVHRQQLVLQAINVKRYQQPSQPQSQQQTQSQQTQPVPQQAQQSGAIVSENELSLPEMQEIGDFFARRAAFEPYDASRLASFVTMLTLPVPVLREFINLIAWKKEAARTAQHLQVSAQHLQVSDPNQIPRPKLELCLENLAGSIQDISTHEGSSSTPKSSINYDRSRSAVDFTLTVIFDPNHVPHINVAGGAGWLPQCVAVRLRYMFGDGYTISVIDMEGSHGGRACWSRVEDWERCKEKVAKAVEIASTGNAVDQVQGRLRVVAEAIQTTLQSALQQLRKGASISSPISGSI